MGVYTTYSDNELVKLLRCDDENAFEEIYHRYWKRMYAMAFLKLKKNTEAEDIVQDVFTSLWRRRAETRIEVLENWLSAAMKYNIINSLNRRLKKEIYPDLQPDISYTDSRAEQKILNELLSAHIERLPEKCRIVFLHSHNGGFTNKEIASKLNVSEKTVEKHITTARRQLNIQLRQLLQAVFL